LFGVAGLDFGFDGVFVFVFVAVLFAGEFGGWI